MIRRLQDADVQGKRVLVRVDFNVPMADGSVSDDTRLRSALPTLQHLRAAGAKTVLAAHFGRPKGQRNLAMSLAPVATPLAELLGHPVKFVSDCVGSDAEQAVASLKPGDVVAFRTVFVFVFILKRTTKSARSLRIRRFCVQI